MNRLPDFPEPSWSVTREKSHSRCPRKYYYQYYASWQGWPKGSRHEEEESRHAYFWNNRETAATWAGKLVHAALAQILLGADPDSAKDETSKRLSKEWSWSSERGKMLREMGIDACAHPKEILLMEHVEQDLPGEIAEEIEESTQQCIDAFLELGIREDFSQAQARGLFSSTEDPAGGFQPRKITLSAPEDGKTFDVWSQLDCAYEHAPGKFLVYDWKTGRRPEGLDESTLTDQLLVYATYVLENAPSAKKSEKPEVEAYELYLPEKKAFGGSVLAGDLEEMQARVVRQARGLTELHEVIRDQGKLACEPKPCEQHCRYCSFRKMCDQAWESQG